MNKRADDTQTSTGKIGQTNQIKFSENETIDSTELSARYSAILPQNLNIFNDVESLVKNIEDGQIKNNVEDFMIRFKYLLTEFMRIKDIDNNLSKLNLSFMEDGSVILEWIYNYFRIGVAFEKNEEESSYYIVVDDQKGSLSTKTGLLKKDENNELIASLLNYVLGNT